MPVLQDTGFFFLTVLWNRTSVARNICACSSIGRAHRVLGRGIDIHDLILRVAAGVLPRCGSVRSIGYLMDHLWHGARSFSSLDRSNVLR